MSDDNFFVRAMNFFRKDVREVVGAYFDGDKIFVAHLAENVGGRISNSEVS